jgi:nicotinate-nucleotide adenylyltransferase
VSGTGILGGSFNPPHLAHLVLAETAYETLSLRRVIFVPARRPPHKTGYDLADAQARLDMVRLAISGHEHFEVSDVELKREGPSYSLDTVKAFREEFGPDEKLFFLVGMDSLAELPTWHRIQELARLCRFVPVGRPGVGPPSEEHLDVALGKEEARAVLQRTLPMPLMDISSTDIRRRVAEGKSIRHLVPDAVAGYIASHNLYREAPTGSPPSPPRPCCGGA